MTPLTITGPTESSGPITNQLRGNWPSYSAESRIDRLACRATSVIDARPLNVVKSPLRLQENGTQQAREPRIQFGTAQCILMYRARDARMDETGLAQYPEVMGHTGFGAAA